MKSYLVRNKCEKFDLWEYYIKPVKMEHWFYVPKNDFEN